MIEVEIKKEWIEEAEKKAKDLGILNHSIMKGKRNKIGFLGEIIVSNYLKAKIENTYDYDIVKNGITIDVKSKQCKFKPLPHYECSIAAYNTKQKCDLYVFVRIDETLTKAWICGIIGKKDYFSKAILRKKGFVDQRNGMIFKADSYNLEIKNLVPLQPKT